MYLSQAAVARISSLGSVRAAAPSAPAAAVAVAVAVAAAMAARWNTAEGYAGLAVSQPCVPASPAGALNLQESFAAAPSAPPSAAVTVHPLRGVGWMVAGGWTVVLAALPTAGAAASAPAATAAAAEAPAAAGGDSARL